MMVKHIERAAVHPIPSLSEFPLLGSLPALMRRDSLAFLLQMAQHRQVCSFHLGPMPLILFTKAEHAQSILVEHASDLSKGRLIHRAFSGNGLCVSEGEFHRGQRKLMAPVFQPRQIASYAETMVKTGERTQQEWQDGAVVDLNQHMIAL